MNVKHLIGLMAGLAAAVALCGCASAPTRQETAQESATPGPEAASAVGTARNVWMECVRAAVSRLDDSESPSDAVARAAMKGCSDEHTRMVAAVARTLAPTCARDADCARSALAKVEREAEKAATQEVLAARVRASGSAVLKCQ